MPSEVRVKFLKKKLFKGLKLPFWGLNFVEFWCWGLMFGGQGAWAPGAPGFTPDFCEHLGHTNMNIIPLD